MPSLEKISAAVYRTLVCQLSSCRPAIGSSDFLNETHRKHGSPIPVPETPSAFHPRAQRGRVKESGRGCGVGRGLGVGVDLGAAVGVDVAVAVGLGLGVIVAVAVGVGVGVTWE